MVEDIPNVRYTECGFARSRLVEKRKPGFGRTVRPTTSFSNMVSQLRLSNKGITIFIMQLMGHRQLHGYR